MGKIVSLDFAQINLTMPDVAIVNQEWGWSLKYLALKEHLPETKIRITVPAYQHQRSEEYLQTYNYWKPNYVYIDQADDVKTKLEIKQINTAFKPILNWEDSYRILEISLPIGLQINQEFIIKFGGINRDWLEGEATPSYIGQFAPFYPNTKLKYSFEVAFNNQEFQEYPVFSLITLLPTKAEKIKLFCVTKVKPNEQVQLKYLVCDRFNNPIFSEKLVGSLVLVNLKNNQVSFINDQDLKFSLEQEGYYLVDILNSTLKVEPTIIRCINNKENIYWGDIHNHSNLSANIRDNDLGATPSNCYNYAQHVTFLDYMCLSEQTDKLNNQRSLNVNQDIWKKIGDYADQFYSKYKFVTFAGIELHSKRGDTVVLFKDSLNKYPFPEKEISTIKQIWDEYDNIITIPHFHVYSNGRKNKKLGSDYQVYNQDYWCDNVEKERLVEVFSSQWGRFENLDHSMNLKARSNIPGNTVQYYLAKERKWGITAGSDMHDGRPGYGGLTAVVANELTRESIYNGLYNKQTYATTGPRFYCHFSYLSQELIIDVLCPSIIESIEIVIDDQLVRSINVDDLLYKDSIKLTEPIDKYAYLRIKMRNGHIGWSNIVYKKEEIKG